MILTPQNRTVQLPKPQIRSEPKTHKFKILIPQIRTVQSSKTPKIHGVNFSK